GRARWSLCARLFLWGPGLWAEESIPATGESTGAAVTASDPQISLEQLRVMVRPLTRAELEVESQAWFEQLRAKAQQIARLRLGEVPETPAGEAAKSAEAAPGSPADEVTAVEDATLEVDQSTSPQGTSPESPSADRLTQLSALQSERTALKDRLEVVLSSLEQKGGDATELRQYAVAVSRIELETTDAQSALMGVARWATSKEGGQRWAWNIAKFIAVLLSAYIFAGVLGSLVNWLLERKVAMSQLAETMIANTIKYVVLLIGFAVALTTLEIDVTPILAAMGAAGLVVGLALQNSLSNVASGIMILVNRPFDVGDVVTAGGVTGTVRQMNLVSTMLTTFDNQAIHVPNNEIWNNVITNVTANDTRRVDLEFGIGYDDDFDEAERIIGGVLEEHELVLADPAPVVLTHALADSSVNLVCRPWVKTSDWWQVKTDVTREVKRRLDAAGISIPYPQRDVHVYQASPPAN
ncbi:MAG: mechanosensitive ion channel family protein, partial [Planctomycetota bacterium]